MVLFGYFTWIKCAYFTQSKELVEIAVSERVNVEVRQGITGSHVSITWPDPVTATSGPTVPSPFEPFVRISDLLVEATPTSSEAPSSATLTPWT